MTFTVQEIGVTVNDVAFGPVALGGSVPINRLGTSSAPDDAFFSITDATASSVEISLSGTLGGWAVSTGGAELTPGQILLTYQAGDGEIPVGTVSETFITPDGADIVSFASANSAPAGNYGGTMTLSVAAERGLADVNTESTATLTVTVTGA